MIFPEISVSRPLTNPHKIYVKLGNVSNCFMKTIGNRFKYSNSKTIQSLYIKISYRNALVLGFPERNEKSVRNTERK